MTMKKIIASSMDEAIEKLAAEGISHSAITPYLSTAAEDVFTRYRLVSEKERVELVAKLFEFARATGLTLLAKVGFYGYELLTVEVIQPRDCHGTSVWYAEVETDEDDYCRRFFSREEANSFAYQEAKKDNVLNVLVREGVAYGEMDCEAIFSAKRKIVRGIPPVIPDGSSELYEFILVDGKEE